MHKWMGPNNAEHGQQSLYSFSWLQHTQANRAGLQLTKDAYVFVSAYDEALIKRIMKGILTAPEVFCGAVVKDIEVTNEPDFSTEERLFLGSPILLRQREGDKTRHITFRDEVFEHLLTLNLKAKLRAARLSDEAISLQLDKEYAHPQTKLVDYKGIKNKTTLAPVIIKGTPEQISFAWTVGLGQSTGIGFGSIK
jgi:CRISPR-associated endoribonuclease Cas6